jgi:hypothetical protein
MIEPFRSTGVRSNQAAIKLARVSSRQEASILCG